MQNKYSYWDCFNTNFANKAQKTEWNILIEKHLIKEDIKNTISFIPILFKYSSFFVSLKCISLYIFIDNGIE